MVVAGILTTFAMNAHSDGRALLMFEERCIVKIGMAIRMPRRPISGTLWCKRISGQKPLAGNQVTQMYKEVRKSKLKKFLHQRH